MPEVRSPITGNVWQVAVQPGDEVRAGQVLVILESMKMEIPVEATASGRVTEILVEAGDSVGEGHLIATIG